MRFAASSSASALDVRHAIVSSDGLVTGHDDQRVRVVVAPAAQVDGAVDAVDDGEADLLFVELDRRLDVGRRDRHVREVGEKLDHLRSFPDEACGVSRDQLSLNTDISGNRLVDDPANQRRLCPAGIESPPASSGIRGEVGEIVVRCSAVSSASSARRSASRCGDSNRAGAIEPTRAVEVEIVARVAVIVDLRAAARRARRRAAGSSRPARTAVIAAGTPSACREPRAAPTRACRCGATERPPQSRRSQPIASRTAAAN